MRKRLADLGAGILWRVGIETLGYPPVWAATGSEIAALVKALPAF